MEMGNGREGARSWAGGGEGDLLNVGGRVSILEDEEVLKMDDGDGCTIL